MPGFPFDDGLTNTNPIPANVFSPPPPPPKSKRQEKRERKKAEWDEKNRLRAAQRAAEGLSPHVPDREIDFLKNKRQQETQWHQSPLTMLPIWEHQEAIRAALREKNVLVMLGETGSGKSTQIGQFLVKERWMARRKVSITFGKGDGNGDEKDKEVMVGGCIAITQPRRVAATNLARRVAQEMGCHLGDEVGYSVRFDNKSSEKTRIKFLTDGMLLQEMLHDPLLRRYSAVVVDEAHERTVGTDLVMGFLRGLVYGKRKDLKVIVMSATLEVEKMVLFFERERDAALAFIKANERRKKGKKNVVDVNENGDGRVDGGKLPNEIEKGRGGKKGKKYEGTSMINGNPYNWKSDKEGSSPPFVNGERKGSVEGSGGGDESSSEDFDTKDEQYDGTVATFKVPGRQFPVEIYYAPEPVEDYVYAALKTVFQLHYAEPLPGDILVFLTGQEEIESLQKQIEDYAQSMDKNLPKASIPASIIRIIFLMTFRSSSYPYTLLSPLAFSNGSSNLHMKGTLEKSSSQPTSPKPQLQSRASATWSTAAKSRRSNTGQESALSHCS